MNFPILVLVVSFVILLVLNVPVAFCMGIAATLAMLAMGNLPTFVAVAHNIATGIDSFSLLAIPFFIFSGLLMGHGGIARRLIDFANVLVGRFRGGLHVFWGHLRIGGGRSLQCGGLYDPLDE